MRLPEFLRTLSPVGETLAAIESGCAELAREAAHANAQLSVSTADEGLSLWERDYRISPAAEDTLSDRRARIRSAVSGARTMTPAALASMAVTVGGADSGEVTEHFPLQQVDLVAVMRNRIPEQSLAALQREVARLKPAHLQISVSTRGEYDAGLTRYAGLYGSTMIEFL